MHLDGYGASIDFDGQTVVLTGGKVQAKLWGAAQLAIPISDIIDIRYRAATMLVNGELQFTARRPAYVYRVGGRGLSATPDNGLVVHWRKKDQSAFQGLFETLPIIEMSAEQRAAAIKQRHDERNADIARDAAIRAR